MPARPLHRPAPSADSPSKDWVIRAHGPRPVIEAALIAHEDFPDWDPDIILTGGEVAPDRPEEWRLEAYLPRPPSRADRAAIAALFTPPRPRLIAEVLPDIDWVTHSQQGLGPVRAGRFIVHTPHHSPPPDPKIRAFVIPASRAFGTGHHATTAGCLEMLCAMKARGVVVRNLVDIGTGSGLLAFAGLHLWPRALATASDIDAACVDVVLANAAANDVPVGGGSGAIVMTQAAGLDHPLLAARAPYDLAIANILAGPLVELAPAIAVATIRGAQVLLAGLLTTQECTVRAAFTRAGFRLAARAVHGDWSVLWLRRRARRDKA